MEILQKRVDRWLALGMISRDELEMMPDDVVAHRSMGSIVYDESVVRQRVDSMRLVSSLIPGRLAIAKFRISTYYEYCGGEPRLRTYP